MNNYVSGQTLNERAVSGFPVSIGTSLALESIFDSTQDPYDPERKIPQRIDVNNYQAFFVNVSTLFRNLSSAIDKQAFLSATTGQLVATLEEEIEVITSLFQNEGGGVCKPIFYFSDHSKLRQIHVPGFSLREPTSELQKYYESKFLEVVKLLMKHTDQIHHFTDKITPEGRIPGLILTHQPYDLLSVSQFSRLDMVESNTGILKPKALWSSKYYPISGIPLNHLPFCKKLLFIMGDKVLIKPYPINFRKKIVECSLKRNWTPATTKDKVDLDLRLEIRDPYEIAVINSL